MKLLQTRVEDEIWAQFSAAAERRKSSAYELLAEMVRTVANEETPDGWDKHAFPAGKPLPYNAGVKSREGETR